MVAKKKICVETASRVSISISAFYNRYLSPLPPPDTHTHHLNLSFNKFSKYSSCAPVEVFSIDKKNNKKKYSAIFFRNFLDITSWMHTKHKSITDLLKTGFLSLFNQNFILAAKNITISMFTLKKYSVIYSSTISFFICLQIHLNTSFEKYSH